MGSATLLLDVGTWDLVADASGNIAVASLPYSRAQDVACAIKLFLGDYFYNVSLGIPYVENILGLNPPIAYLKAQFVAAALSVAGVASAVAYVSSITDGEVTGQVQITDIEGTMHIVAVASTAPTSGVPAGKRDLSVPELSGFNLIVGGN